MSTIRSEIERYMTGPSVGDGAFTAQFRFPPEFVGFQGHFPGKKVLPGVCQVQCALIAFEKGMGCTVVLKEVVLAKYFAPVLPDEEIVCRCSDAAGKDGELVFRALLSRAGGKVSELKLRVAVSGPAEGRRA